MAACPASAASLPHESERERERELGKEGEKGLGGGGACFQCIIYERIDLVRACVFHCHM